MYICGSTMKNILLTIGLIFYGSAAQAQLIDVWSTLAMVDKKKEFNVDYGYEIEKISVTPLVQALENTEIEVNGYFIPLSGKGKQNHFMLSSLPANMCFFCGKAGPETAMQVFMKGGKKVAYSDNKIKLKGKLIINPNSENEILYTLDQAELIN